MTDVRWTGNAHSIKDVWKGVVGGTYAAAETIKFTIGVKDLIITLGSDVSLANVVTAIFNAFNNPTRLDGRGSPNASSNFGGQEFGEFAELECTSDGATAFWLTGKTPGKPVTISMTITSASGTRTFTNIQVATGSNHYDNVDNWDTGALPGNTNRLVAANTDKSILYGLPAGGTLPTLYIENTFTGRIGLPEINRDDPNKPYREYRTRSARWDDSVGIGVGQGDRFHTIGIGVGRGSDFMFIVLSNQIDGVSNVDVYGTGSNPVEQDEKCLKLQIDNTFSGDPDEHGYVNVLQGSVNIWYSTLTLLSVAKSAPADVLLTNPQDTINVTQAGDSNLTIRQEPTTNEPTLNLTCLGGVCTVEDYEATLGGVEVNIIAKDGKVVWNTPGKFTSLKLSGNAIFDAEQDMRPFTGGAIEMSQGSCYLDRYGRNTAPVISAVNCDMDNLAALRFGQNKVLTITNIP